MKTLRPWPYRLAALLLLAALCVPASARDLPTVRLADLPREARDTLKLIRQGGPFPHAKDGVVFGNREKVLPAKARGQYHEYTVPTPGARNRGARRIVCAGETCYYSGDHYATFKLIQE